MWKPWNTWLHSSCLMLWGFISQIFTSFWHGRYSFTWACRRMLENRSKIFTDTETWKYESRHITSFRPGWRCLSHPAVETDISGSILELGKERLPVVVLTTSLSSVTSGQGKHTHISMCLYDSVCMRAHVCACVCVVGCILNFFGCIFKIYK